MPQVTELEKGAPTVQDGSDNSDSDSDSVPELEDAGTGGQSQVNISLFCFLYHCILKLRYFLGCCCCRST